VQLAILTTDDAPADSRAVLDGIAADLGLVPNLAAATAASPALLAGFDGLRRAVASAKLDPVLREIAGVAAGVAVHPGRPHRQSRRTRRTRRLHRTPSLVAVRPHAAAARPLRAHDGGTKQSGQPPR
jgi:hypothetical protein